MIDEKALEMKAKTYASGVAHALKGRNLEGPAWADVERLLEAAYFNAFQSGVCWQKEQFGRPGGKR